MQRSRRLREELGTVREGLTLGCVSLGLMAVPNDRETFVLAAGLSWSRWPHAFKFEALTRGKVPPGELIWEDVTRVARRTPNESATTWRRSSDGAFLHPVLSRRNVEAEALLADVGPINANAWLGLATNFMARLGETAVVRPTPTTL